MISNSPLANNRIRSSFKSKSRLQSIVLSTPKCSHKWKAQVNSNNGTHQSVVANSSIKKSFSARNHSLRKLNLCPAVNIFSLVYNPKNINHNVFEMIANSGKSKPSFHCKKLQFKSLDEGKINFVYRFSSKHIFKQQNFHKIRAYPNGF